MTPPFTPLWARWRPAEDAAPHAWVDWPGPVVAAGAVPWRGGTAYASIGFTTPHRLTVLDAATGERLAPALLCDADRDVFALAAGPTSLVAVGKHDVVEPLNHVRDSLTHEGAAEVRLVAAVSGSAEPRIVTAHSFEGIRVWDAVTRTCRAVVPLPELASPGCLCAGLLAGTTHIAVSEGAQVSVHEAETGRLVARWTAAESEVTRMSWAHGWVEGGDAVLTADANSRLRAWDPRTGEPLGRAWPLPDRPLHLSATVLDAGGTRIPLVVCAHGDGVRVLRTDTDQVPLDLRVGARARTAHLTADGLLLLGTSAGPLALRLDTGRLASASEEAPGECVDLDPAGFPVPERGTHEAAHETPRAAAALPSHSDLVALWGADHVLVLGADLVSADLDAQGREVLCGTGLPLSPVPGLSLDQDLVTDGPAPLDEVGVGPVGPDDSDDTELPEGLDGYHWLGTWHDDDLVLSPTGAVEIVGAETEYEEAQRLNSGLGTFVAFAYEFALVALQQEPEYGLEAREARVERLERRLRAVDATAFAPGSAEHWRDALSDLEAGM
ncbi:SUKH-4 family immunity protein [Streptomyces noursei]|uniref:SUKH-4 family immunity protein n=1 Tax=Streptomyces noursei TaxID=1971 RepID=UPI00196520E6|nr:SUKH-4 family immunity protein [Streptomyces noursei]QRX90411.1 SUKH-4 family immunity protein [Streptomyces noursei]